MLIKCPECGKEISDRCVQCIHCGYPLIKTKTESNTNKLTNSPCPVCGNTDHILSDSHSEECPCCGYIFNITEDELKKQRGLCIKINTPKCPTCGSTNIKKISSTTKVTNTVLFGIFGNKRKKQFHCESCGYEW